MYISKELQEKKREYRKRSNDDVNAFISYMKKNHKGIRWRKATNEEDAKKHIDIWIWLNKKWYSFDIKGRKKLNQKDSDYNDEAILLELLNVDGENGWLLGEEDLLAFRNKDDSFLIVDRLDLLEISYSKIDGWEKGFNKLREKFLENNGNIQEIPIKPRMKSPIYDTLFTRFRNLDIFLYVRREEVEEIELKI